MRSLQENHLNYKVTKIFLKRGWKRHTMKMTSSEKATAMLTVNMTSRQRMLPEIKKAIS